jgi:hypothetical protein
MFRILWAAVLGTVLAGAALAQSQTYLEAREMLRKAGATFELPSTATEEQINQIVALGATMRLEDPEAKFDFVTKSKEILGIQ